jgi:glycosyltransferase involved in cell wall biosynthesis
LIRLRQNNLDLWGHDPKTTEKVKHPELNKPHFYEFQRCFHDSESVLPYFDKGYSYDEYYEVKNENFHHYINNLLSSTPAGCHPVLQFNRTSMRINWFAEHIENALNISMIRNPRDQFDSYAGTANGIFLIMNLIIITRSSSLNPFASLTREFMVPKYESGVIRDEIKYYSKYCKSLTLDVQYKIFFQMWLESIKHSQRYADQIINMNRIHLDVAYRHEIESVIGCEGLFDGFELKTKSSHCLKINTIIEIENEELSKHDDSFVRRLREEYYLDEPGNGRNLRRESMVKKGLSYVASLAKIKKPGPSPVISIITPSYNQEEFIGETIRSVLEQSGNFYIDYIIMDGLSGDDTLHIIKECQSLCTRGEHEEIEGLKYYKNKDIHCLGISFRFITEKDEGQADAINKGFSLAKGEIFGWINSDDIYYSPYTLSIVADNFRRKATKFIYGRGIRIDRNGLYVREEAYVRHFKPEKIKHVDFILQPSSFWRRQIYEDVGLLNTKYRYAFDWDYWIRISERFDLKICQYILSCYRVYEETKTCSGGEDRDREIIELLKSHDSYNQESLKLNGLGSKF